MSEINKFACAFIAAQQEMGNAVKDSKNPFFKSSYADLNSVREACIPLLNKHKIGVLQPIVQVEGKNFVKTILLHESGEKMEGMTEIIFNKQNDAQAQGSGITYARRYGLQSLVNIGAEDDDGNAASAPTKKDVKETQKAENEKQFRRIKALIEASDSEESLKAVWIENAQFISALKKYANDLFVLLEESKSIAKLEFEKDDKVENEQ